MPRKEEEEEEAVVEEKEVDVETSEKLKERDKREESEQNTAPASRLPECRKGISKG